MFKLSYYHTKESLSHSYREINLREGILKKSETVKIYTVFAVGGMLCGTVISALNVFLTEGDLFSSEEKIYISVISTLFSTLTFMLLGFLNVRSRKRQVQQMGELAMIHGFDQKTPKQTEFFEDRLVMTSPYKRYTAYYDELIYAISDRVNFTFLLDKSGNFICVPKDKQDPELLFQVDKLLKEKLKERFIYEMGVEANA